MQSWGEFDIGTLLQEAQSRWLKPTEVLFILQNNDKHHLTLETPQNPPSGSLFLFNRRVLRFFRKDGHNWRKKKDGRTVGEAHERLKVGNVDALNCYYAHGEKNPSFQRRSYWMLDPAYDHIVLVHYREVTEGRHSVGSVSNLSAETASTISQSVRFYNAQNPGSSGTSALYERYRSSFSPGSLEEVSSKLVTGNSDMGPLDLTDRSGDFGILSGSTVNQALKRLEEQLSLDDDSSIYFGEKLPSYFGQSEKSKDSGLLAYERVGFKHNAPLIPFPEIDRGDHNHYFDANAGLQDNSNSIQSLQYSGDKWKQRDQQPGTEYIIESKESLLWEDMLDSAGIDSQQKNSDPLSLNGALDSSTGRLGAVFHAKDMTSRDRALLSSYGGKISADPAGYPENLTSQWLDYKQNDDPASKNSLQISTAREFLLGPDSAIISPSSNQMLQQVDKSTSSTYSTQASTYKFKSGKVMLKKTNSIDWTESRHIPVDDHNFCPDYSEIWFDQESHVGADSSLTIAQIQRFSIREISPEWAYSSEGTKVIITGDFLCDPSVCTWACLFGDIEVPLEIIQVGVVRCHAPPHPAGKVILCITAGNRESCSEVREFEYRSIPKSTTSDSNLSIEVASKSTEEILLLARFSEMLLLGYDSVSAQKQENVDSEIELLRKLKIADDYWGRTIKAVLVGIEIPSSAMDWIMQELLKDRFQQWLSSKHQEGDAAGCSLSKQEQGIIHLISGLGYEWALNSILNCGIGVNFRDANGWTALHWAAHFGREKMVAALLAAGASAVAVTDPTSQDPPGKTPASIAAASGHKGLAGYLSEVALTSHLSSLTFEEKDSEISKGSAAVEAERTVESISSRNEAIPVNTIEDQLSLKESLAAVRNAAQAAARIQSAFRAHSFRKRQQRASESCDEYGMTPIEIHELATASKFQKDPRSLRDHKLNKAALSIQKKYRGWKRRQEFLTLRQHVVKIQAHVRGHQVRKKYREFIWTVGVLEKAVLRWRRRGVGLRGFKTESESIDDSNDDDILKVFRKQKVDAATDEAVSRVLSMVESPEARQQYRRLLGSYRQAKAELRNNSSETASSSQANGVNIVNDDDMDYFS